MRRTTRQMSDAHEESLVEALGGRRTPGSGNQYNNPMDGRHNRYVDDLAFAWDGKSTLSASITIDLAMVTKAREQALSERPMLALRWYATERLAVAEDWVAITLDDMQELVGAARSWQQARAALLEWCGQQGCYCDDENEGRSHTGMCPGVVEQILKAAQQ